MTTYAERPWLARYPDGLDPDLEPDHRNLLRMFDAAVQRAPEQAAVHYFDGTMTVRELDEASDAFAAALLDLGFLPGDRIALYTQNDPAVMIGMLAAWKAGGVAVAVNPMYKQRELGHLLRDSGAAAVLCLDDLHPILADVLAEGDTVVRIVVGYSARDGQSRHDARVLGDVVPAPDAVPRLAELISGHVGATLPRVDPAPEDTAYLVYTSGTTGDPKGARLTHRNFVFNARSYREWMSLTSDEPILGVAPLFHITGLVGHGILALSLPAPLILAHRFVPDVMVDAIREHRPVFSIGAITAYSALAGVAGVGPDDFASLTKIYSGGAPIAPAVADRLEKVLGGYIHNAYGLTETSSITHLVPPGERAPVDPASGALSIGVPIPSLRARIVDDSGTELPSGETGEVLMSGPQVADGYWGRPDATATSFPGGELHTGDVGFMDDQGWFYLVDRKKDMIIASGYKVWPREVEDVLYGHPAVREAAVVGVPDEYRGETVHAFVSFEAGESAAEADLIAYCRERMAAYKYPRVITVVDELPKTLSGKILRRELRG